MKHRTKRKLAELYYGKGKIDNRVLAKLLVLQKLSPALFIELNEWNKRFTTMSKDSALKCLRTLLSEL